MDCTSGRRCTILDDSHDNKTDSFLP